MKIYFAGSIRGGRDDKEKYKYIIDELKLYGQVLTEHIGLDSLSEKGQTEFTEKEIYEQDVNWIWESDIVIADVTVPSLGVGYELGFAASINKKVVCLFDKNSGKSLSAMVRGNKYYSIYEYSSLDEIPKILKEIFNR